LYGFLIRRLLFMVMATIGATLIVFSLSRLAGDPRNLYLTGGYVTQEQWDAWGDRMGLNRPVPIQYAIWLSNAIRLDFGESLSTGEDAFDRIRKAIPATLQLAAGAWIFTLLIGVPLGVLSAVKRGTVWDFFGRTIALFGQALPPFWIGLVLILIFSVQLGWLPTSQRGGLDHYILPSITLGWLSAAGLLRLVRSSMLEVLDSEYVKFARAKGVKSNVVIWKHAFRNAIITPLTFAGLLMVGFLTGTVVTESVFAWPGLGRLTVEAINNNDFPLMTGSVLVFVVLYVGVMFLLDVMYALLDPRIRNR
jgi:peptide/nickel transport system permease protein